MSWNRDAIELQIDRQPRLGIALSQYFVRQCIELQDRIESVAIYKTRERVMLGLLQLVADLGVQQNDGTRRMSALTHQTIAEFVGTSREIVTAQMNRLRTSGLLRYSRLHIDVFLEAMTAALQEARSGIPPLSAKQ